MEREARTRGREGLIAEGREAEIFGWGDERVLKLMREPEFSARLDREAAAMRALTEAGQSVPAVHERVTVEGRPGLVIARVAGTNLLDILGRRPYAVLKAGRVLAEVHLGMHDCRGPIDLPDLNDELRVNIGTAEIDDSLRERVLAILDQLPAGDRLCHGDLHLGNILGDFSRPVPIDWGGASRGDPLADVARTDVILRFGDTRSPGVPLAIRAIAPLGRRLLLVRYLSVYGARSALDRRSLDRWRIVRAAARLAEGIEAERASLIRFLRRQLAAP